MTQTDTNTWAGTPKRPKQRLGQGAQAFPLYNPATADSATRIAHYVSGNAWLPPQMVAAVLNDGVTDAEADSLFEKLRVTAIASDQTTTIKKAVKPLVNIAHQDKKTRKKMADREALAQQAGAAPTDQYNTLYGGPTQIPNAKLAADQTPVEKGVKAAKKTVDNSFSFTQFFDDPVLQKHPSAGLAFKQYVSGAIGQWPVEDAHLAHVQQQLQLRGYGHGLHADGVYGPEWQAATSEYTNDLYHTHLSGNGPGAISLKTALQGLEALQPTNAFDAVLGFIQTIPDDIRDTLADVAGSAAGLAHMVVNPSEFLKADPTQGHKDWHGDTAAGIQNFFGNETTSKKEIDSFQQHFFSHLVRDMSTVYLLTSTFGVGKRLATAIGEGSGALPEAIAARGPGVIAHTIQRGAHMLDTTTGRTLTGAALGAGGTAAAGGDSGEIFAGAVGGGLLGNVLARTNVFSNIPVLGQIGPTVDTLLDGEGLYYKTRAALHGPYKYAPVRIAGQTFQDVNMLGAKIRGAAALQSMDAPTAMSEGVQGEHTFSTVDAAIAHRLHLTVLGQSISPSINDFQFILHGGPEFASKHVAQEFQAGSEATTAALGTPGWNAAIQRLTGHSWEREAARFDTPEHAEQFWAGNIANHAAGFQADYDRRVMLATDGIFDPESISNKARIADLQARKHVILNDPELLASAVTNLRAQGINMGIEDYVARVKVEEAYSRAGPRGSNMQSAPEFMRANQQVKNDILPYIDANVEGVSGKITAADKMLLGAPDITENLGLARTTRLTRGDANKIIASFEAETADINERALAYATPTDLASFDLPPRPTLEEWSDLRLRMMDSLYDGFGVDPNRIPHKTSAELLDAMRANAALLASDVTVNPDAPQFLKDAVTRLHDQGYKLVAGTDIGQIHTARYPVDVFEGPLTWRRKAAEVAGLNPTTVSNRAIGQTRTANTIVELDKAIQAGKIKVPNYFDATTLYHWMNSKGFLEQGPGYMHKTLLNIFRTPERVARAEGIDTEAALREINAALSPTEIPRKNIIRALTNPNGFEAYAGASSEANNVVSGLMETDAYFKKYHTSTASAMDTASANEVVAALRRGARKSPTYQLGISRLDDMFRASMGFAGKGVQYRAGLGALAGAGVAYSIDPDDPQLWLEGGAGGAALAALGGDKLGWAMANLPNRLMQLRDQLRFDLSPMFSVRRVFKANVKMGAEGVPYTINPLAAMERTKTLAADRATLARVFPESYNPVADAADKYLRAQDIFGLYNARNYEAYAAGHWARKGLSDADIRAKIVKTFEYGAGETAGRSALERSANFVFFPFSFDKTLYRNMGYYLLDNPAQRVVITRGIAAYDQFNKEHMDGSNPFATSFYTKHLPIFTEAAHLNAFAHGISPGELGGINRPLLNLFLPQNWAPSSDNLAKLERFIPAVKDFQRVYEEASDQGSILAAVGTNMWRDLHGIPATYGNPAKSTLTTRDQMNDAFAMQRNWYTSYAEYIDHNASTTDADEKYRFPASAEWGRYAGEPITKANIRDIIAGYYPAYDPNGAVAIATKRSAEFTDYVASTKPEPGTPLDSNKWDRYNYVTTFQKKAEQLGRAMTSTSSTAPTGREVAQYTDILRQGAIWLSEHDPKFYALYQSNFERILGPLERVQ